MKKNFVCCFNNGCDIGLSLMVLRKRAKLSQTELGKNLRVSHAAISDIERNVTRVSWQVVLDWIHYCGYSADVNVKQPWPHH